MRLESIGTASHKVDRHARSPFKTRHVHVQKRLESFVQPLLNKRIALVAPKNVMKLAKKTFASGS